MQWKLAACVEPHVQSLDLVLDVVDNCFQCCAVCWICLLTKMIQVHVIWNRYFSVGKTLQEIGFATAVLPQETVSSSNSELNGAVLYELPSIDTHAETIDFDVTRGWP